MTWRDLFAVAAMTCFAALGAPASAQPPTGEIPGGTGPFKAAMLTDPSLPTHTLYRPEDLAALQGAKLPIVAWANGACANNGAAFKSFLTEIASHGYLVVAIGPPGEPSTHMQEPAPAAAGPGPGVDPTQSSQLIDAINWAQAQNTRPDSPLKGRLAVDQIAVMGQSCGGLQALDVSPDPRVRTSIILNSGIYTRPGGRSGIRVSKDKLNALHAPIAYLIGGPKDIAYPNASDDVARIDKVPVFFGNIDVGHTGAYREPNGGRFAMAAVAWLDWRLKGEARGRAMFVGADCGLCRNPDWTVQRKNLE